MKKFLALTLALLMLMWLVACGNSTTGPNVSDDAGNMTETETPGTSETSTPEETPEATDEPEADTPTFDTSWASNDFEAMIPELPFTGWTVKEETDSRYELELGGLKTANGADTATGFEEDKDALITYLNSLPAYGFTVEETGDRYEWLVTDDKGNTIEFTCGDGFCWVTFKKAN